jgi:GNAT superfamily N-acetyltransferase
VDRNDFAIVTYADHPDLRNVMDQVESEPWPEFMFHDAVSNGLWNRLYDVFPDFQFGLLESRTGRLVAMANSIPLAWHGIPRSLPDDGWDWAIAQGFDDRAQGVPPHTLCALCISISHEFRGKGLSSWVVQAMRDIGSRAGFDRLIAPVRPNLKAQYPLIPIDEYVVWTRADGKLFDAWMRVHSELGATVVRTCPRSMRIVGNVSEWEKWTGLYFPGSGQYVIPGALVPVLVDRDADTAVYVEPNVWMVHELG